LDTNLTTELKEEGIVRDIIRGAQEARKNAGLVPSDDIVFIVSASAETVGVLQKNEEMLKKPIQAVKVEYVAANDLQTLSGNSEGGETGENETTGENNKTTDIGMVELENEKVLLKVQKV
jgi:isoleucyl-tRNA synthetase